MNLEKLLDRRELIINTSKNFIFECPGGPPDNEGNFYNPADQRISDLEENNQPGQRLKILTPDQMLCRLPITLAQLQAGNNSQKLKNEIRQQLYSFYRSKKITKAVYNILLKYI